MTDWIDDESLLQLDAAIDRALATRDDTSLKILGYGEISSVVAWPTEAPVNACKRLPLFDSTQRLDAYRRCFDRYLEQLDARGVALVDTRVRSLARADGRLSVYCVQPILSAQALAPVRVQAADSEEANAIYEKIFARVERAVGPHLGLDAQLSNWVIDEGEPKYLDVSTPLLRDERGRELLDTDLFLSSLPWALRGLVKLLLLKAIMEKYYDVRGALLDLVGNLQKEGVDPEAARAVANRRLEEEPISPREAAAYYRSDARMWALLQWLRRADRAWQTRVRRRVYPFLLPGAIERHV